VCGLLAGEGRMSRVAGRGGPGISDEASAH
jgi:hypothetical protein